ncbi:MAG: DUF937 domain-containing protein [Erysipelotrichaceae bacterium]|nr:DUF937 domain-containing protein [Erysipelotrichaceae bacterium]
MDIVNMLMKNMTSKSSIGALIGKSGASADSIEKALTSAIPSLIGSMTKNASTEKGAKSLLGALSQHNDKAEISSQIENADEEDGNKIIGKIMGGGKDDFVSSIAKKAGLDIGQTNSILSSIAPAILSTVSAAAKPDTKESQAKIAKEREEAAKSDKGDSSFLGGFLKNFMKSSDDNEEASGKSGIDGSDLLGMLQKFM